MGRGNFRMDDAEFVFIETERDEFAFDDLTTNIASCLSPAFTPIDDWNGDVHYFWQHSWMKVGIADNEHNYALVFDPNYRTDEELDRRGIRVMHGIVKKLKEIYEIRYYGGPWTGGSVIQDVTTLSW